MLQRHFEDVADMFIAERIEDDSPLPAVSHQMGVSEDPQLMGDCGHGHVECGADIAYAHLPGVECQEYSYSRAVREYAEEVGKIVKDFRRRHGLPCGGHAFAVYFKHIAAFVAQNWPLLVFTRIATSTTTAATANIEAMIPIAPAESGNASMTNDIAISRAARKTAA